MRVCTRRSNRVHPAPLSEDALLYEEPILVPVPAALKPRAWEDGTLYDYSTSQNDILDDDDSSSCYSLSSDEEEFDNDNSPPSERSNSPSPSKKFEDLCPIDQLLIKINTEIALRNMPGGMAYVDHRHSYLKPLQHPRVEALRRSRVVTY